jgi:hypothetical protein
MGSRGTARWYLRQSIDHYCCCHYFAHKTRAYCISGSAELFPQHCQVPCQPWSKHLKGLSDKMVATLSAMTPRKQQHVLTFIQSKLTAHGLSSETAPVHTFAEIVGCWHVETGSKQLTCVCQANISPTCWPTCWRHDTNSCQRGYR